MTAAIGGFLASGKVRDIYAVGADRLLIVASDRISAFDHVLPTPIPEKGAVLTGLSVWWFGELAGLVPNHLLTADVREFPAELHDVDGLSGRAMICRRLQMIPVECVARGYLVGSGYLDYQRSGEVCGHRLPPGLRDGDRLPEPIFTPATKAARGEHDMNVTVDELEGLIGADLAGRLAELTLSVYRHAAAVAERRGLILADTKFEFGRDEDGQVVLADEVLTPDSSRYWPAQEWRPGAAQPSFDKQFVRDWLLHESGWDRSSPPPALPDEIVAATRERYIEAYERITGASFAEYLAAAG